MSFRPTHPENLVMLSVGELAKIAEELHALADKLELYAGKGRDLEFKRMLAAATRQPRKKKPVGTS